MATATHRSHRALPWGRALESVDTVLSLRFGELSPEVTARVQAADEQALERLSERVITASTLSGVFDDS